jgi:hypothetical protein
MIVVAGLILVGLLVAALAASGLLFVGGRPAESVLGRSGWGAALVVAGGIVLVLVLLVIGIGLIGLPGPSDVDEGSARDSAEPAPEGGESSSPVSSGARPGPRVRLVASDTEPEAEAFPASYEGVDGLEPNSVLRVSVEAFPAFAKARAWQCVSGTDCGNPVDVQFGEGGVATFQYLVVDDFVAATAPGRCRPDAAPCSIVVEDIDGDARAEVQTVFHDELPPPGRIRVSPRTGLVDGQAVTVEVEGYPAGATVDAMVCVAPAATGRQRCGSPGPTAAMTVGPDGSGRTTLVIRPGPVGDQRLYCGPGPGGRACGVSVASPEVFARAPVVPIGFAGPAGAAYDSTRVVVGLAVAAFMLGLAIWLIRCTDWSPIGEEAAPEIDDADYADLDAIVAALPAEDADSEMVGAQRH